VAIQGERSFARCGSGISSRGSLGASATTKSGGRLAGAAVFVAFGVGKFTSHGSEVASFRDYGLPEPDAFVYAVGVLEIGGGLLLLAGLLTRLAALALAGDMVGAIAVSGIVYAPGRAGTTQELFQDAAQNAYGIRGRSPMVLLGRDAYGREPSLFAVLRDQARRFGRFEHLVTLVDEPADALDFIRANEPAEAASALGGTPEDILSFMRNERVRAK